jgi:hypothetical protein
MAQKQVSYKWSRAPIGSWLTRDKSTVPLAHVYKSADQMWRGALCISNSDILGPFETELLAKDELHRITVIEMGKRKKK